MQTFFIAPMGFSCGVTTVSLGLIMALEQAGLKVGFIKPIAQYNTEGLLGRSNHFARLLLQRQIPDSISSNRLEYLLSRGEIDLLMEEVMQRYQQAAHDVDIMIVEGLQPEENNPFAQTLNQQMVRNLQAGVILISNATAQILPEIAEKITINTQLYAEHTWFAGIVLNRLLEPVDQAALTHLIRQNAQLSSLDIIGMIPNSPELLAPRSIDIANYLKAQVIHMGDIQTRRVHSKVVTARSAINILPLFKSGALIITPGDREDVVMAAALSALKGIPLAGVLFTSNILPDDRMMDLCQPALASGLPIMLTENNSYHTANLLGTMSDQVPLDDTVRMQNVVSFVAEHIDTEKLSRHIDQPKETRLTPPAFRYQLMQKARSAHKRIVLPEGEEPRTVRAAAICHEKSIARCVLLGKRDNILQIADAQGIALPSDIEIIEPSLVRHHYIDALVEQRKHKGMNRDLAASQLEDEIVLGTMMLALNEVDGLVAGALNPTANILRPALQLIKTAPDASLVSSVFFMLMPDQVYVYADCAVNPDPTAEQLADIAIQSAHSAKAFGIEPRVAMISYSTGTSGDGDDVEKVRKATKIAQQKQPSLLIDGPMQYDAASVISVGQQKAPNSPVAGNASVFIFPDLNTGNTTYKAVQRSAHVISLGPMLQGLRKPVNDLSRGALVDDIVYTIALTAIQAMNH